MLRKLIPVSALLALTAGAQANCQLNKIETDLNGIRLEDGTSAERVLGNREALPIGANDKGPKINDFPELIVYNRDRTEQALLTQYPGSSAGEFAIIKLQKPLKPLIGVTIKAEHLFTERGVRLGVSEKFVTDLLGKCYSRHVSKANEVTIEYNLADPAHPYIKRTSMPNYFGRYRFRDGKLVWFELGSDYP